MKLTYKGQPYGVLFPPRSLEEMQKAKDWNALEASGKVIVAILLVVSFVSVYLAVMTSNG